MTILKKEILSLPGSSLEEENPLPFFRDPQVNLVIKACQEMPPEKKAYMGWETAFRVLPYRMQDQYTRDKHSLAFHSLVLENEYLKAVFLPEVGGRLYSLVYKPEDREILHRNPVFQPANLAIRNAWFSGGIEWNIGQFGHTFTTCSPVFASAIVDEHGEPGLRIYEFERCKNLFWQIDFYLPTGSQFLVAYTRVINPCDHPTSMYWWTNTAVDEKPDVRVLAPAREAIYATFEKDGAHFCLADLPYLPSLEGIDGTYSTHSTFANEFFFQCDEAEMPWEAALDGQGKGFIEASTPRLKYRKMFCWGTHPGGRHWQEFLSQPGQAYLEIQAGLASTQVNGLPMPARTAWDWTQIFGYIQTDPSRTHGEDWQTACAEVETNLRARLGASTLPQIETSCRLRADIPSQSYLHEGAGWAALEIERRKQEPRSMQIPAAFVFPSTIYNPEQMKWLSLLETRILPDQNPSSAPGEWMVQKEWEEVLEKSTQPNWYSWLHLGVMRLERFNEEGAAAAWKKSIDLNPSVWAYRNLAVLSLRKQQKDQALAYYDQAWRLAKNFQNPPTALTAEYLQMLLETAQFQTGLDVYNSLPVHIQNIDRIQILRGQLCIKLGDLKSVEDVLQREFAVVREGEITLSDLWFELHTLKESARTGRPVDDTLRKEIKQVFPPPARIDFRSINE